MFLGEIVDAEDFDCFDEIFGQPASMFRRRRRQGKEGPRGGTTALSSVPRKK